MIKSPKLRCDILNIAEKDIAPEQGHTFQIEQELENLHFYVDGDWIQLLSQPNLPVDSTWNIWFIEGSLAGPKEPPTTLDVVVYWVAIKP
jgi:hypothetical protein